jgi:hypothetical protein
MSNDIVLTAVGIATLVVIVVGVTVAVVELRQEVLARRLQGMSALFSEIWPESMSTAVWNLMLGATPEPANADMTVVVSHYNRLGFLLHQGLVKESEILGYPPFGIVAAEMFAMLKEHMDNTPTFQDTTLRENSVWWEYLAIQAKAYWETTGRAVMAEIDHYNAEPTTLMRDWTIAMNSRKLAS